MPSYRQQLLDGKMPDWDLKLRKCVFDLRSVVAEILIRTKREGQSSDNAFEDGGLVVKLDLIQRMISEELPPKKIAT